MPSLRCFTSHTGISRPAFCATWPIALYLINTRTIRSGCGSRNPRPCLPTYFRYPMSRDRGSKQGFEMRAATGRAAPLPRDNPQYRCREEVCTGRVSLCAPFDMLLEGNLSFKQRRVNHAEQESCNVRSRCRTFGVVTYPRCIRCVQVPFGTLV